MAKTYIFGTAFYTNGTCKNSRNFTDPEAFSRWANKQFSKDEGVTIYEYEMTAPTYECRQTCTWHA